MYGHSAQVCGRQKQVCGSSAQEESGVLSGSGREYTGAAFLDGWAGIPRRCATEGNRCAELSHGCVVG